MAQATRSQSEVRMVVHHRATKRAAAAADDPSSEARNIDDDPRGSKNSTPVRRTDTNAAARIADSRPENPTVKLLRQPNRQFLRIVKGSQLVNRPMPA